MSFAKEKQGSITYTPASELEKQIAEKIEKLDVETNPIITHKFAADPAVLVYKDTVYVYATNDMQQLAFTQGKEENRYNKINTLNVFSSKDLVNWTDLGEVKVAGKNGGEGDAAWASNSWAPAIACKNIGGKDMFFLYFADPLPVFRFCLEDVEVFEDSAVCVTYRRRTRCRQRGTPENCSLCKARCGYDKH